MLSTAAKPSAGSAGSPKQSTLLAKSPVFSVLNINHKRSHDTFTQDLPSRIDAPRPAKYSRLPYPTKQTGFIYDVRMRFHAELVLVLNDLHPEDPRRIHAIYELLVKHGLVWNPAQNPKPAEAAFMMGRIHCRPVTKDEVLLVHSEDHYNWVQSLASMTDEELKNATHFDGYSMLDSLYLSKYTPICAALSAGGAIEACDHIMNGSVKNALAIIRPPGHHAEREDAKGFCFFDNVSIATKYCLRKYKETCKKVLILDWDVHHGNGIQQAHYDNPDVLYISLHVYKTGNNLFYPEGTYKDKRKGYGNHLHSGEGAGLGYNINIPWTQNGMRDGDYLHAFEHVIMPVARTFNPDLVVVAAGFDAAEGDMLGQCHVSPEGYAQMTHMLMSLAGGKVAVCLEGGYNLQSIANSCVAVARTLMGEPPGQVKDTQVSKVGRQVVDKVIREQSKYWDGLFATDPNDGAPEGKPLHEVVLEWQARDLWDSFQMSSLPVTTQDPLPYQVMATRDYGQARPLLVVLHEPPAMVGLPDAVTHTLDLHNTWLKDGIRQYIKTAFEQDLAVIDINLPVCKARGEDDQQEHMESDSPAERIARATALLKDVYDSHIKPFNPPHIILLGTESGHAAITNFIKQNEEEAMEHIDFAVSFIRDTDLTGVRSATNDDLTPWYHRSSSVYISEEHGFWSSEFARKPRRKFGGLKRMQEASINKMLMARKDEVFAAVSKVVKAGSEPKQDVVMQPVTPSRLPPISNFALNPRT